MILLIILIVIGAIVLLGLAALAATVKGTKPANAYTLKTSLLTEAELRFFHVLHSVTPSHLSIMAQVSTLEIFATAPCNDPKKKRAAHNKINQKHVDFLLVETASCRPALIIELDDRSHQRADRAARDQFLDATCAATRLPILHIPNARTYDAQALGRQIQEQIGTPTAATPATPPVIAKRPAPAPAKPNAAGFADMSEIFNRQQ